MRRLGRTRKVKNAWQLWRNFGTKWLAFRVTYAARQSTGQLARRLPATEWIDQPCGEFLSDPTLAEPERYLNYRRGQSPAFFFDPVEREAFAPLLAGWDHSGDTPLERAGEIAEGTLRFFERTPVYVGFPPAWHRNAHTGQTAPADRHWSQIRDFDYGDIKLIWEPSRFGFVYPLVRAYWRTGEQRYPELFWQLIEDWKTQNPPQYGPNWKCGQEASFRVMAWCFGLYGFMDASSTTAERVLALAQAIAVSGRRIEGNLSYALSQRNNHGISEGMGLWTIGVLFPELRFAAQWRETGRRVLEELGRDLIYDDGAFIQHSVNYHRLMLHDYLWALRLGELNSQPFSSELEERVGRAGAFLYQIQDAESGRVPYYGANDGALILPLDNCDYQDFRPVLQATHYMRTGARCYENGPWDEDLLWLYGKEAVEAPIAAPLRTNFRADIGGCYTVRAKTGFAFLRCASFRDRPGHADMLHVDLWWRGQNVAADAGTFSYNAPAPWDKPFSHTAYHNTVTVDGLDQMDQVARFMWMPWLRSQVRCIQESPGRCISYWEGEHDGYRRLKPPASHRRGVLRIGDEWWLVLDRLVSQSQHHYRLHWLFPALPYEWDEHAGHLSLDTTAGKFHVQMLASAPNGNSSLINADESGARGWRAPYYSYREPALSVDLATHTDAVSFWTLFGPAPVQLAADGNSLQISTELWQAAIRLREDLDGQQTLVDTVSITGGLEDQLEIPLCAFS